MNNLIDRLAALYDADAFNCSCDCVNCRAYSAKRQVAARTVVRRMLSEGTRDEMVALVDEVRRA